MFEGKRARMGAPVVFKQRDKNRMKGPHVQESIEGCCLSLCSVQLMPITRLLKSSTKGCVNKNMLI